MFTANPAAFTVAASRPARFISKTIRPCTSCRTTILRYGSLYGPRADKRNAIHRFVHEALTTGAITYYGAPTALREYVHVDDASTATLAVLAPEFENQNIIISGNQPMRVGDLFKMIGEMLGKELAINYQNDPNSGHYQVTPYAFMPKVGRKAGPPLTVDLGQGILRSWKRSTGSCIRNCRPKGAIWSPRMTEAAPDAARTAKHSSLSKPECVIATFSRRRIQ